MHWFCNSYALIGDCLSMMSILDPQRIYRGIISITEIKMLQMDLKQRAPPTLFMTISSPKMRKLQGQDVHPGSSWSLAMILSQKRLLWGLVITLTWDELGVVIRSFSTWPESQEEGGYWKWKECDGWRRDKLACSCGSQLLKGWALLKCHQRTKGKVCKQPQA